MDAALLSDAIFDIFQNTNSSLAPPATRLSTYDIQQFENLLKEIHEVMLQKAMYYNSQCPDILSWSQKVKEVVNDLKDLMEDLEYAKKTSTTTAWFIKASQNIMHRLKVKHRIKKLKVTHQIKKAETELKHLATEAENLSFSEEAGMNERKFPNIYHEFENFENVGRENDKKEIISELNKNGEGVVPIAVVSLVGIAGIGKTKLAHLVCKDEQVKAHFGSPIWVHVNEAFNVESIAQHVTETAANRKRFLLVLDDFINEIGDESFIKLHHRLTEVAQSGGTILITTRSNVVANKIAAAAGSVGSTVKLYALHGLNQEDSWYLFRQIRGQGSSNIKEDIEWEMVREYCGGVPLVIITVARLLNSRESSVSKSEAAAVLKEEFLRELKFTYYDQLPMHQKLCFAYCSLFPQHHLINAEWLIHLWIAEGFLSRILSSKDDPQEFGFACFKDFAPLVFQQVEKQEVYQVNPLMHELARIVAWDENITVDLKGKKVHERIVRASIDFTLEVYHGMLQSLFEKAKKLRTILLLPKNTIWLFQRRVKMTTSTCDKIFKSFKRLHVLDLHGLGIKVVPSSIGKVKHLRYLDLSHNICRNLNHDLTTIPPLKNLKSCLMSKFEIKV